MAPGAKLNKPLKTKPPQPVGYSREMRIGTKAANNLARGFEHINNIYTDRKLFLNGLGMVLGYVNDEFDKFMALEPQKPVDSGSLFEELFGAITDIVSVLPPLSIPIKLGKTAKFLIKAGTIAVSHSQEGYAKAKSAAEAIQKINGIVNPPPDDPGAPPPPDKGSDAYLREAEIKFPLIQKVISAIYLAEYERRDAIAAFQDEVDAKMDDPTFAGNPLSIAVDMFGPAPGRKTPDDIYKEFSEIKERLFREIVKAYVGKYAVFAYNEWIDMDAPAGHQKTSFWGLYSGLNDAQWRALLARCGVPNMSLQQRQKAIDQAFRGEKASKLLKMLPAHFQDIMNNLSLDPNIDDPGDLVMFWNARKVIFRNISDWHGFKKTTDWHLTPHR